MDTENVTLGDVLKMALRGGFKSSEFWLAVVALLTPWATAHLDTIAHSPHATLWTLAAGAASAVISAAYTWAAQRRKVAAIQHTGALVIAANQAASIASAKAGEAAGIPPLATGGNVGTPAPR